MTGGAARGTKAGGGRRFFRSLAWRLYLVSLVQLVLLAVAVVGVGMIVRPPHHEHERDDERRITQREGVGGVAPGEPARDERHHRPPGPAAPLLTFFLSGLVIVAVGAALSARWVTRPLERLAGTARALGGGDLRARTGLDRDDEVGDVARAFDEMATRVHGLVMAERELMANVSHELRTPLARIGVHLELANEGDAATVRASLGEIAVDLKELTTLMDDILTTTRLELAEGHAETARFRLHLAEIEPAEIVLRAEERFRAHHPERPLEVSVQPDLPSLVLDAVLFRRVLENLLENAHRYTPEATRPIVLRVTGDADEVVFAVSDEGIGIAPQDLARLFTPFFRTDRSRSRVSGGVGLGLALAKRILDAHGGTIALTSALNGGTTAKVRVPVTPETIRNAEG